MQKHKAIIILLLSFVLHLGVTAQTPDVGKIKYRLITANKTASVVSPASAADVNGDLTILEIITYGGVDYRVTSIEMNAFSGCAGFTGTLTIPSSITSIGVYAFYNCSGLSGSLTIPSSVTSIGDHAFYNCKGLKGTLTLDCMVSVIKAYTFYGCNGFTGSLTLPNTVTSIGDYAFSDCSGFTGSLSLPNTVTSIGNRAFINCAGFTGTLTLSSSLLSLGGNAFYNCSGFTGSLVIPANVTTIEVEAFCNCRGFTGSLFIGNSVTKISKSAFTNCSGFMGNLTLPPSLTHIEDWAFASCKGFSGPLVIPNSVMKIGNLAFYECSGFTETLTIPSSVSSIGNQAFWDCLQISDIVISNLFPMQIGEIAFPPNGFTQGKLRTITFLGTTPPTFPINGGAFGFFTCGFIFVPNTLSSIYKEAVGFTNNVSQIYEEKDRGLALTSLAFTTTPSTVKFATSYSYAGKVNRNYSSCVTYATSGFPNSWKLVGNSTAGFTITCSAPTESFTGTITATDALFSTSVSQQISFVAPAFGCAGTTSVIDGVNYQFNSDGTATVIALGNGLKYTGTLNIPTSVVCGGVTYSVTEIGANAFSACTGLTGSLTIPSSIVKIGNGAFASCMGFKGTLTLSNGVNSIGVNAFADCNGFTGSLIIPNSVKTIGTWAFLGCSGFTGSLAIGEGVTFLGQGAFTNCSNFVGTLALPKSITSISLETFSGCSGFNGSLTIGESVTIIGDNAFNGCSGLKGNLALPTSVTSIGDQAFFGCEGFTNTLVIPNTVTTIKDLAFSYCVGFTGLTISESISTIGASAFRGCSGLSGSISIPSSTTMIGAGAFNLCNSISDITVSNVSITQIGYSAFPNSNSLKTLTFLGNTPPVLSNTTKPLGVSGCANIIIPNGSLSTYLPAVGFSDYFNQIYEEKDRVFAFKPQAIPPVIAGSSYTYSSNVNRNNSDCITYTLTDFPDGWQISKTTGGFTLTGDAPTQSFTGTITATEAISGAEAIQSISFVSPPTFTSTHITTVTVNQPYSYTVSTQDLDKETLTISFVGTLPTGLTLGSTVNDLALGTATALLSGSITTAGSYTVSLIVTDAKGASTPTNFIIVVANSQYTITFDTDGGTAQAEQIYTDGNSEPLLVSTSKPGYTFLYWSINGVKVVNTGELTAGDKTVKAVWEICQNNSFAVNSYEGVEKPYLWSTFLDVPDKSMETLFGNKPIKYIEDTNGSKWYPASSGNVSEFANYVNGAGYAVYPDGDFVWNMCGKERDFTSELISLKGPYTTPNIIGNPYSKKVVIDDVLFGSGIFKRDDIWGIFGVTSTGAYNIYIPGDGFEALTWEGSQIPTFEPGHAYYIYYYPDKTVSFSYPSLLPIQGAPSLKAATNNYMPQNVRSLDRFMLLSIDDSAIDIVYEVSAEWRIYSTSGAFIGKDYVDNYSLMMIDGYDLKDGESMELRYYSPTSQKEYSVTVLSWTPKSSTSGSTVALEFYHMADLIAEHLTVSTTPVSENTLLAKASSISVYPNPAKDKVTLTLNLDDQAKVCGSVYNTSGEYLMTAIDDVIAAGKHNLDINVSLLPSGMYLLKIQVGNRVELVKLVVEK